MKYDSEQEANSNARKQNDQAKKDWFCPYRNDKCYGVGCIAFDPAVAKGKKVDEDYPQCNLSSLEEMPGSGSNDSGLGGFGAGVAIGMGLSSGR